jgi:NUMOD4 motif-containing protein
VTEERWKRILKGRYAVSDQGRVMSTTEGHPKRQAGRNPARLHYLMHMQDGEKFAGQILRASLDTEGYRTVSPDRKTCKVAVLVARTFLGPALGREVHHKDTVKTNDWLENLEYLTVQAHHRRSKELGQKATGDRNGARKHPESMLRGERWHAVNPPQTRLRGERWQAAHPPESIPRGAARKQSKLTDELVRMIRSSPKSGAALARELGLSKTTVSYIRTRKSWKHVS